MLDDTGSLRISAHGASNVTAMDVICKIRRLEVSVRRELH